RLRSRNPKPETRNPKTETRNPKTETRNPKTETRNPKPETLNPNPETRNPKSYPARLWTDHTSSQGLCSPLCGTLPSKLSNNGEVHNLSSLRGRFITCLGYNREVRNLSS
ncbi:hypothetical protein T484DRAFT_1607000, partial [Baffinella frigidus]